MPCYMADTKIVEIIEGMQRNRNGQSNSEESLVEEEVRLFFQELGEALQRDSAANKLMLDTIPVDVLIKRFKTPLEREIAQRDLIKLDIDAEERELYLSFLLGGVLGIYGSWLSSETRIPLDTVAERATAFTLKGLGGLSIPSS